MKRITILLQIMLVLNFFSYSQDTIKVNSKVKKVVVFLKGAQIKRTTKCYLQKGENIVNFTKISSHIDEKSIQVKSDSTIAIQSVNFNVNYLDSMTTIKKISSLKNERDSLDDMKLVLGNTLDVLKHEQDLLKQNQVISGEKRIINTEELKEISIFYHNRLSEIILLRIKTQKQIKQIENKNLVIQNQLKELNSKKSKPVGEIWLIVYADESGEKEFLIEYFISDAGWIPKYDIRAESVSKPVLLTYKADVYQNTDDDWINVELILSSSNPVLGGTKPELKSWTLNLNKKHENDYQNNSDYQNSVAYYLLLQRYLHQQLFLVKLVTYHSQYSGFYQH